MSRGRRSVRGDEGKVPRYSLFPLLISNFVYESLYCLQFGVRVSTHYRTVNFVKVSEEDYEFYVVGRPKVSVSTTGSFGSPTGRLTSGSYGIPRQLLNKKR